MNGELHGLIQIGVVGLRRTWEKLLRPALLAAESHYRVVLVADPSRRRADDEAARLRCASAPSVGKLVHHPEVDALLLADATWQGLWPLEEALALGKPVLSAVPLGVEATRLASVEAALTKAERTVQFLRLGPNAEVMAVARERLTELGPVRRVQGESADYGWLGLTRLAEVALELIPPTAARVQTLGDEDETPLGLHLTCADGPTQLWLAACGTTRVRFGCERGGMTLVPSRGLRWKSHNRSVRERLPIRSTLGQQLVEFYDRVWAGAQDEAGLARAGFEARILAAAAHSLAEGGRTVEVQSPGIATPGLSATS